MQAQRGLSGADADVIADALRRAGSQLTQETALTPLDTFQHLVTAAPPGNDR